MLRSILIALDGSAHSKAAVELAIRWARRFDAQLVGLGVVDEPAIRRPEPVPIGASYYKAERDEHRLAHARRRVEKILGRFARRCTKEGINHKVLEDAGAPDAQIVEESRTCDLVMLGQMTRFDFETPSGPDQTLRGVLRRSYRPVVVVPEAPPTGRCIVVAYDGGQRADLALQALQALGLCGEDAVHVISINADVAAAARVAQQAVDFLTLHGARAAAHPLAPTTSVDRIILARAEEMRAHLLVMGASIRPAWQEFVFSSVTTNVLKASAMPVFLCR